MLLCYCISSKVVVINFSLKGQMLLLGQMLVDIDSVVLAFVAVISKVTYGFF